MSIAVKCPGCNYSLTLNDGLAGKRMKCPQCSGAVAMPNTVPPTPPAVPASPPLGLSRWKGRCRWRAPSP